MRGGGFAFHVLLCPPFHSLGRAGGPWLRGSRAGEPLATHSAWKFTSALFSRCPALVAFTSRSSRVRASSLVFPLGCRAAAQLLTRRRRCPPAAAAPRGLGVRAFRLRGESVRAAAPWTGGLDSVRTCEKRNVCERETWPGAGLGTNRLSVQSGPRVPGSRGALAHPEVAGSPVWEQGAEQVQQRSRAAGPPWARVRPARQTLAVALERAPVAAVVIPPRPARGRRRGRLRRRA